MKTSLNVSSAGILLHLAIKACKFFLKKEETGEKYEEKIKSLIRRLLVINKF